jgi:hypothetical protein
MIKRFNNFKINENKDLDYLDTDIIFDAFADLIDSGADYEIDSYEKSNEIINYFEIMVDIPGVRLEDRVDLKTDIDTYLKQSNKQNKILSEISISIKTVYNMLGIYPEIKEESFDPMYKTNDRGWYLIITYEKKSPL